VGRVWPRQGHRGRPLNSVVSHHANRRSGNEKANVAAEAAVHRRADPRSGSDLLRCACRARELGLGARYVHRRDLVRDLESLLCLP